MFVKCETYKNKIYYTSLNEDYNSEFKVIEDFKIEAFKESPLGKWKGLINNEPLKKVEFDSVSKYNNFLYKNKDKVFNNIKPEYQYIRYNRENETPDKKLRIWLWDIEADVMPDGSFPDPYKYEELPSITLMQVSEFDTKKKIILGWKRDTEVYKLFPNCIYKKFDNEVDMINAFIKLYRSRKVNILTAHFGNNFDFPYIVKRCNNLGINYKQLSPFNEFKTEKYDKSADEKYDIEKPIGAYWIDYVDVYKKLNQGSRESFSLGFLANYEGVEAKLDYTVLGYKNIKDLMAGKFSEDYCDDKENSEVYQAWLDKDEERVKQLSYDIFVKYGILDVVVMQELEEKMKMFETLIASSQKMGCNIDDSLGTTEAWTIYVYNDLYKDNIALPAKKEENENDIYHGGYVFAIVGIHRYVLTEDVTSQYPHNIMALGMSPESYIKRENIPKDLYEEIKELHNEDYPEDVVINWSIDKKNRVTELLQKYNIAMSINGACFDRNVKGVIPKLVEEVFNERKVFKDLKSKASSDIAKIKEEIARRNCNV